MNTVTTHPMHNPIQNMLVSNNDVPIKKILLICFGVAVLAFASQLSIPLQPVPLTFQSATVDMLSMMFGMRYGTSVIAAYLVAGACGLPVFADYSGGVLHFFAPTGGYLLGFLPAAMVSGYLAQRGWTNNILSSFAAAAIGAGIIFVTGIAVLSLFIGFEHSIKLGLMPFILSECIKLFAVALIVPRFWKKS